MEKIYKEITAIIKESVKNKMMGPIYRVLLKKAIDEKLFFNFKSKDEVFAFAICHYLKTKGLLSIDKFAVNENFRNDRYGKALLNIIKEKFNNIRVEVVEANTDAYRFYERHGFKEISRRNIGNTKVITMIYIKI